MSFDVIRLYSGMAQDAFDAFCVRCASPAAYGDLLYQTYQYVRVTVPVIRAVAEVCREHPLATHLDARADEELGHAEMLLDDIRSLELDPVGPISPHILDLVALEYSAVGSCDPVSALLGHIVVMEGFAPRREDIERVAVGFGVKLASARALLAHADADIEHGGSARALMEHPSIARGGVLLDHAVQSCRVLRSHWLWMMERHRRVH